VGAEAGKVAIYEAKSWARVATLGDELDAVLAADLSPDGAKVVFGGPGRVVKVVGNPDGKELHAFRKPTDWVTAAAFGPDGLLVAGGDRFGGLFLWEARSGREFLTLRGHTKAVNAVAWPAGGDRLLTAGDDGSVRVWDLHAGQDVARWDAHAGGVLGLDVHPSGRIASAGRDRRVRVWEADGTPIADLGPAADQVNRVCWAADGRSVVAGDGAGEVRAWSLADSSSALLPMPVAERPAALALVAPVLAPARRHTPKPPAPAPTPKPAGATGPGDDVADALASAREAAAAADRAVDRLSRLVRSRGGAVSSPSSGGPAPGGDALGPAADALASLRAALAADPGNALLRRAVGDTEEAVRLLGRGRDRASAAAGR
jgi:hypothetical protein